MSLRAIIAAEIAATGPMRLDRYMGLCLGHPRHGYYMTRDPFGADGDFITAPEISQMFGELIGLWAADRWREMGAPARCLWVELGPGRGTLSADALRAIARAAPECAAALEAWLIETSPVLRDAQTRRAPQASHAETLRDLPQAPALFIANEFFDALPIRQFHRAAQGWAERVVTLAGEALQFALAPHPGHGLPQDAPEGAVLELCPAAESIAREIGARLAGAGGAALIADYGAQAPETGGGDTFQALRAHGAADPLADPGGADLTAHVDFTRLAAALRAGGAEVAPLAAQGAFLLSLGLEDRARALMRAAPARFDEIAAQAMRLTAPDQMGALFKVLIARGAPAGNL